MRYFGIIFLFLFFGCATKAVDPLVQQAQIRKMQTRNFVQTDVKDVTDEVIALLQDEGYVIKNVSSSLGLITAEQITHIETFGSKFWAKVLPGAKTWKKYQATEISINITEKEDRSQVRINYLVRVFDNLDRIMDAWHITDEKSYNDFFARLQMGLLQNPSS